MKKLFMTLLLTTAAYALFGQTNETYIQAPGWNNDNVYHPLSIEVTLKSSHLWRGLEVTGDALAASQLAFTDRSGQFSVGIWGGAAFSGDSKEFDYFVSYTYKGFQVAVWDIYNFSPGNGTSYNITDAFNYKSRETGHFIDAQINYTLQGNYPLQLGWATIIQGRDRGVTNRKNLYSTYVWADAPVWRDGFVDLNVGIAGAFALDKESGSKANFYGERGGIVNVNLTASRNFRIGNYVLPVSLTPMWNPTNNNVNMMLATQIFK